MCRTRSQAAVGVSMVLWLLAASLIGFPDPAAADGPDWYQVGADIDGEAELDRAGRSVALSADGNTVIVGARFNNGNGPSAGHARVFQFDGVAWLQLGDDIDGEGAGDQSGYSVGMSADGDRVIVGAYLNDGNGSASGQARVYRFDGAGWVQVGGDIDGEARSDFFGLSVAMGSDGNTVIVGAPLNDGGGESAGQARVFRFDGANWVQVGSDIDGEAVGDQAGRSVALSADGNTVVVGAPASDGGGESSGQARVFRFDGADWIQLGTDIDGEAGDSLGSAVGITADGNTMIVGAQNHDGNGIDSGQAQVFAFDGAGWVQVGADIDGEAEVDQAGWSVAISADGATVVAGAISNDGNGEAAGNTRVFRFDGAGWVQVGADIDGEAEGDSSGWSVALNSNGDTVVVGAPYNDGNGNLAGHARVFALRELDDMLCDGQVPTIDMRANGGVGVGTADADVILGTRGDDVIVGLGGDDTICGLEGHDTIKGGTGDDTILGAEGNDELHGKSGEDIIDGGYGDDLIFGDAGRDTLNGGPGNDTIRGNQDRDIIDGGGDDDTLYGGRGKDSIAGGDGIDTCDGGINRDIALDTCEAQISIP